MKHSTHFRCACRDADGQLLGQSCPKLRRADGSWNSRHGSAGFACRVPTTAGTKLVKRYGYASIRDADSAGKHVQALIALAGSVT